MLRKHSIPMLLILIVMSTTYLVSVFIVPNVYVRDLSGSPISYDMNNWRDRYWQTNLDIETWIGNVRQFPNNLDTEYGQLRINRPVYMAMSASVPRIIVLMNNRDDFEKGLTQRPSVVDTMVWMISLNYIFLVITVTLFYFWLQKYFSQIIAFGSTALLAFSPEIIEHALKPSPEIAGLFISIAVIYLFDIMLMSIQRPSWRRIFLVSICIGLLFFIKAHYHILMAILLWALYLRRWRIFGGVLVFHFIPLILWASFLPFVGSVYYNHETYVYRQVIWVLDFLEQGDIYGLVQQGIEFGSVAFKALLNTFSPFVLVLAAWAYTSNRSLTVCMKRIMFFGFLSTMVFLTLILRSPTYLLFDIYIFLYPLVILSIIEGSDLLIQRVPLLDRLGIPVYSILLVCFLFIDTIYTWLALTKLGFGIVNL